MKTLVTKMAFATSVALATVVFAEASLPCRLRKLMMPIIQLGRPMMPKRIRTISSDRASR